MKIFNRIILVVSTFIYIIVGFFCLSVSFSQKANQWTLDLVQSLVGALNVSIAARIVIFILGLFLIAIALLTIIGNIENKRAERTVVLQSPLGDIFVSLSAIEDFSRIVKNQVKGIRDIKGKVLSKRKGLDVTAKVTLYSDRSVADVTQEIQEAIIQYIHFTLGINTEIKPKVIVSKMAYKTVNEVQEEPDNE